MMISRLSFIREALKVSIAIGTASGKVNRIKDRGGEHLEKLRVLMDNNPEFTFEQAFSSSVNENTVYSHLLYAAHFCQRNNSFPFDLSVYKLVYERFRSERLLRNSRKKVFSLGSR